jgi:hypothetical protein
MVVGHMAYMGQRGGAYRTLVGKTVGKRPPGRFMRRRDDDIKVNLQEGGWGRGLDLSGSVLGQVAGRPTDSQFKCTTRTDCCKYTV